MRKNPLISCIVPVFNGERFIGEALDSILAQTYRPIEVIVVDDGSLDGTESAVAGYKDQVCYLKFPNSGPAAARNHGLHAATGVFAAFLDSDDTWHPDKLSLQMKRLKEKSEIDLCFTQFQNYWAPELRDEEQRYHDHPLSQPWSAWCISTLLAPRTVFEKYGTFDPDLRGNENMVWFLKAATQGAKIEVLPDILMSRRFHKKGESRSERYNNLEYLIPIVKAWRDYQMKKQDEKS